jgi:hypothetical protein
VSEAAPEAVASTPLTTVTTVTVAPPVVRGDIAVTARMETLQDGYLHAVAAAAGCTLARPVPDVWKTDWILDHPSTQHVADPVSPLRVQLKSTQQISPTDIENKESFSFSLPNDLLMSLAHTPVTVVRLLVVLILPSDVAAWIKATPDYLALHHCAYWVNLEGQSITGEMSTTVQIPCANVFDDVALCHIMSKIGKGQKP